MDTKTAIRTIRGRLKDLAVTQRKAKRARKTTIPKDERTALLKELGILYPEWAHADVMRRKVEITALINFRHELLGSPYRHGVREDTKADYEGHMNELRKELVLV